MNSLNHLSGDFHRSHNKYLLILIITVSHADGVSDVPDQTTVSFLFYDLYHRVKELSISLEIISRLVVLYLFVELFGAHAGCLSGSSGFFVNYIDSC